MENALRRRARRARLAILVLSLLAGCTTWGPQHSGPGVIPRQHRELSRVRLYLSDRSMVVLYDARVLNDSIFGQRRAASDGFEPIAFPTSEIVAVELREMDWGRTAGLLVGVSTALVYILYSALLGSYTT